MSEQWIQEEEVRTYLNKICHPIKAKEVHQEVRLEIANHLSEIIEDRIIEGEPKDDAIRYAIAQMGDPEQIGKELHKAHKPVIEWSLIGLISLWIGIGLFAMYAVQFAIGDQSGMHFFEKKLFFVALGIPTMIMFYFMDYRKIKRYSWLLYSGTIILMLVCQVAGSKINGVNRWIAVGTIGIDIVSLSTYLFLITFAGMLTSRHDGDNSYRTKMLHWGKTILLYLIVPGLLYGSVPAFFDFVIYGIGLSMILIFVTKKFKIVITVISSMCVFALILLFLNYNHQITLTRLTSFLNPWQDPEGSGYTVLRSIESITSAGMWGQGFGVKNTTLPYIYSDFIFPYLIYSFGWVFGAMVVGLTVFMAARAMNISRKLKDPYARALVVGLFSLILIQFVWSVLMSIGLMPITSASMPFVSYSGLHTTIDMAAMGLILGTYRRKNMLSTVAVNPLKK